MFLLIYYSNTLYWVLAVCWASLMAQMIKNLPAVQETKVEGRFFTIWAIWVRKIPWRRKWQPAPVFLPGEFCGQESLVGYSPGDVKESDTTEWLNWTELMAANKILICFQRFSSYCKKIRNSQEKGSKLNLTSWTI